MPRFANSSVLGFNRRSFDYSLFIYLFLLSNPCPIKLFCFLPLLDLFQVRLVGNSSAVEIEYQISSVPIDDGKGKEVVTVFSSDINSNKTWYTDSNGREFIQRIYNYRATWDYEVHEPVAGNYAPVNAAIYMNDVANGRQISIINDRSQGGASVANGELELMVHRRTLADDSRGVGEPMNETAVMTPYPNPERLGVGIGIIGSHYLFAANTTDGARHYREEMNRVYNDPVLAFVKVSDPRTFLSSYKTQASFSGVSLPANVELMTLQPYSNGQVLIRVSSQYAIGEDALYSKVTTFDLAKVFSPLAMATCTEMTLTANQKLSDARSRGKYKLQVYGHDYGSEQSFRGADTVVTRNLEKGGSAISVMVSLGPMEIKTFLVTFA